MDYRRLGIHPPPVSRAWRFPAILALIAVFAAPTVCAQMPAVSGRSNSTRAQGVLRSAIEAAKLDELRWPNFIDYQQYVRSFYEQSSYALAWSHGAAPTMQARQMIASFKQAAFKGLNPEDYDASRWDMRIAQLSRVGPQLDSRLAVFDLAMTVCAMRYISDLHIGRVNPHHFRFGLDVGPYKYSLPQLLRDQIVNAADVTPILADAEPEYRGYKRAETALAHYLQLTMQGDVNGIPIPGRLIRPGDPYPAIPQLVSRLRQLGDLAPDSTSENQSVYTGDVVAAVKRFQQRHGLEPDGILGKATVDQLNTPLSYRVWQLDLTLERYRWIPPSFPQPPIVVNIPEFLLRTMRRQPAAFLSMKVVLGRAYKHQTPVFAQMMRYVIFRPYWDVPLSIQRAELVPKIQHDRDYLAANNYEVVTSSGEFVTDGTIDDAVLAGISTGSLHIRQKPGPKNALGLVKFIFPNAYNVYLHGTPEMKLFQRARRDFSHGCIRVEDPIALAAWVLRDTPGWDTQRIVATMNGDQTVQVNLAKPIPVLILYSTATVDPDGVVNFFADIYGHDAALKSVLAAGPPYPA